MKDNAKLTELFRSLKLDREYEVAGVKYRAVTPALDEAHCEPVVVFERIEPGRDAITLLAPVSLWGTGVRPDPVKTGYWYDRPAPGTRWRHYKGTVYEVVTNAWHAAFGEHYVVYQPVDRGSSLVWARPAPSWYEKVPRFAPAV